MLCWLISIDVPRLEEVKLDFIAHPECEFQGESSTESLLKLILSNGMRLRENSPVINLRLYFRLSVQPDARHQVGLQRREDGARPDDNSDLHASDR